VVNSTLYAIVLASPIFPVEFTWPNKFSWGLIDSEKQYVDLTSVHFHFDLNARRRPTNQVNDDGPVKRMQAVPNDLQKQAADPVSSNCDTFFDSAVTVYPILTDYEDAV